MFRGEGYDRSAPEGQGGHSKIIASERASKQLEYLSDQMAVLEDLSLPLRGVID